MVPINFERQSQTCRDSCMPREENTAARFTPRQGQYLAFIAAYTKLNRRPPAESDMRLHFRVTAPTVHQMIVMLEKRGLISRTPHEARSIQLLISPDEIPNLD